MGGTRTATRAWALVVISVLALAAFVLVGGAAEGKVPGKNGKIVFGRFNPDIGDFNIFTANPDGSDQHQILAGAAECPRWSADGTLLQVCVVTPAGLIRPAIATADGHGLALVDVHDPDLNLGCWAWSGRGVLACEGWSDANPGRLPGVFTVRASDGGGLVRLTRGHDGYPAYSPDGTRVTFMRTRAGVVPEGAGALFVMNADGTGLRRITPWGYAFLQQAWSPDGSWIVFQKPFGEPYMVHPDGSGLQRVPVALPAGTGVAQPSWSPDGSRIVFSLQRGGGADIYMVRPDGSDLQRVTGTPGVLDSGPSWGRTPA